MAKITFKGSEFNTSGNIPKKGSKAPDFKLINVDLAEVNLRSLEGKKAVLNIFPSIDTPVCSLSMKTFYEKLANKENVEVLNISADLPFALKRQLSELGEAKNIRAASIFRSNFAKDYGVHIEDGVIQGLCARAVLVLDEGSNVIYAQLVSEVTKEPDYEAAMAVL